MDMNPIDVQKNLKGISYPASRDELVATAEDNGADDALLRELQSLDEDTFESPVDVMKAIAGH
jgi:Protein of unknown function (DUF2795)